MPTRGDHAFVETHDWIEFLAVDPATRSNTSVCLKFTDDRITDGAAFAKAVAKRLADEDVALDIGAYRDAPAGLRIWCGATVETSDIEAMLPWLDWAFNAETQRIIRPDLSARVAPRTPTSIQRTTSWPLKYSSPTASAKPPFKSSKTAASTSISSRPRQRQRQAGRDHRQYDGLAIRSATKVTEKIIDAATNLKVIGRAGIGTDNIDKDAASKKGVIVMNTPFGNMITTAEHAIAMMFAVARQIPEASASTHAGKWEKSKFMGVELTGKTLGVIGAGNIGGIVCDRARGLKMKVVAYDPFLGEEKAAKMGVEKVELEELLARADFITLHVPFTDQTANILSRENLAKTKKGVRIINCARGGLVDEEALADC